MKNLVNHQYKLIIFHIPKVGCSSLIRWMSILVNNHILHNHSDYTLNKGERLHYCEKYQTIHECAERELKDLSCIDNPEYFKCTFVRNPWDRLVSYFTANTPKQYIEKTRDRLKFPAKMTFEEFVDYVVPYFDDEHFRPQYKFLENEKGKLIDMDFIGRFETFQHDIDYIRNKLGIKESFIRREDSNSRKLATIEYKGLSFHNTCDIPIPYPNYKYFYTEELKNKVYELYKKDIELFNYDWQNKQGNNQ